MIIHAAFDEPVGQGWTQIGELAIAFGLSAVIGLERELKQRAAGVRTYTVVGFASALFMLVSKYGFTDVLGPRVVLDPSRVAAQIVTGLGFIGGGIIFVRRGSVRGLTTAASIWLTAAVGAAAGAGLEILAVASTIGYFLAILLLPPAANLIARRVISPWPALRVHYLDGRGLLREVLSVVTQSGFVVAGMSTTHHRPGRKTSPSRRVVAPEGPSVEVKVQLGGRGDLELLMTSLSEMDGILHVSTVSPEDVDE
ncbi:MgtC/SapB family protein [Leekyejoonella antrihumi]|uniref:MgtC/SapB family protein n=1 Tax=Leekyejoonella antrihumi TaxID=1660198 RepID=A0A563E3G5_9MICO|nr:MgtC/SapB family protein [Leekyejoonella antrihumi]TWP36849.1 MgtC/SapB family protein [Leekyejoonella antrihumi]